MKLEGDRLIWRNVRKDDHHRSGGPYCSILFNEWGPKCHKPFRICSLTQPKRIHLLVMLCHAKAANSAWLFLLCWLRLVASKYLWHSFAVFFRFRLVDIYIVNLVLILEISIDIHKYPMFPQFSRLVSSCLWLHGPTPQGSRSLLYPPDGREAAPVGCLVLGWNHRWESQSLPSN